MATPISIVTGFLGSGKTTLLRHVLERGLDGRRVALIVNEIGAIGFDGEAVGGRHVEQLIELTSGCICCTIGSDFLLAVEELITLAAPDLIIVETTGLAEPGGMIRQARAGGLTLDAVVTLVDAANITRQLELSPVARWQIRAADFLALNKCDLATPAELSEVEALLHAENSRAACVRTVHGALDAGLVFGTALHDPAAAPPPLVNHLGAERIATLLWRSDTPLERQRLEATLRNLPPQVYRAKGLVHCTDAPWPSRVNVVCGRVDYETTRLRAEPPHLNQLVLIGPDLEGWEEELRGRLDACADSPARAADWRARRAES